MQLNQDDEQALDLLLYLNTRCQHNRGKVRADHMSADDVRLAESWHVQGFIEFRSLRVEDVDYSQSNPATHVVQLSTQALDQLQQLQSDNPLPA